MRECGSQTFGAGRSSFYWIGSLTSNSVRTKTSGRSAMSAECRVTRRCERSLILRDQGRCGRSAASSLRDDMCRLVTLPGISTTLEPTRTRRFCQGFLAGAFLSTFLAAPDSSAFAELREGELRRLAARKPTELARSVPKRVKSDGIVGEMEEVVRGYEDHNGLQQQESEWRNVSFGLNNIAEAQILSGSLGEAVASASGALFYAGVEQPAPPRPAISSFNGKPQATALSGPARKWASIPEPGEPFWKVAIPVGDRVRRTQMADRLQRNEGFFEAYSDIPWLRSRLSRAEITLPDETEAGSAGKQPARGLFASNNDRRVADAPMAYRAPAGSCRQEPRFFGRIGWISEHASKIHARPGDASALPS